MNGKFAKPIANLSKFEILTTFQHLETDYTTIHPTGTFRDEESRILHGFYEV